MYKLFLFSIMFLAANCLQATTPSVTDPCDELSIESANNTLTISNIKAAHTNMEVYQVRGDGSWNQIFSCNDNCGGQATVKVEQNRQYIIHVKMFDGNWNRLCEKQIQHNTSGEVIQDDAKPSCENVVITGDENGLTVNNVKAPHSHVDIYAVRMDGGWNTIFSCNDNCKDTITAQANTKYKHIVHVKLFSESWQLICEKNIEYNPQ